MYITFSLPILIEILIYFLFQDHTNLTITLIAIVFFFIIGEIPTQLVSRQAAVTFLFDGDQNKADISKSLETFRQLTTVLNAINLSVNFVLYILFCPPFCRTLKMVLSRKQKSHGTLQVNIFVMSKAHGGRKRAFSADVNVYFDAKTNDSEDVTTAVVEDTSPQLSTRETVRVCSQT